MNWWKIDSNTQRQHQQIYSVFVHNYLFKSIANADWHWCYYRRCVQYTQWTVYSVHTAKSYNEVGKWHAGLSRYCQNRHGNVLSAKCINAILYITFVDKAMEWIFKRVPEKYQLLCTTLMTKGSVYGAQHDTVTDLPSSSNPTTYLHPVLASLQPNGFETFFLHWLCFAVKYKSMTRLT